MAFAEFGDEVFEQNSVVAGKVLSGKKLNHKFKGSSSQKETPVSR